MNRGEIAKLLAILKTIPGDPRWCAEHVECYTATLIELPDSVAPILRRALLTEVRFRMRPTYPDLTQYALSLMRDDEPKRVDEIVAEIYGLCSRYGAHGQQSREYPGLWVLGAPPMSRDAAQVVAAFGGWVEFCQEDSPPAVRRGQVMAIAKAVVAGQSDETLNVLRADYRAQIAASKPAALECEPEPVRQIEPRGGGGECINSIGDVVQVLGKRGMLPADAKADRAA